jgi:hypothetical protein
MYKVKNILDNINTLDGFMTNDEVVSCALDAEERECMGPAGYCYNCPSQPEPIEPPYDPSILR